MVDSGSSEQGLRQVGASTYAYLQTDKGAWSWSNAGLVADSGQSLLVDTLFQVGLTKKMLAEMADAVPSARKIDKLINTHADADHIFGNQVVSGAHIMASKATASEFLKVTPQDYQRLFKDWQSQGEAARYLHDQVGQWGFDFSDVVVTLPHETIVSEKRLNIGNKNVILTVVGPAHTAGDVLVHSVEDRVVFTGDLLFNGAFPVIWDGSIEGWIAACDHILAIDVDVVVPGHGPLADKSSVTEFRAFLLWFLEQVRGRFEAGLSIEETAVEIAEHPDLPKWHTRERIIGAENFLYRKYGSSEATDKFMEILGLYNGFMAKLAARSASRGTCNHAH